MHKVYDILLCKLPCFLDALKLWIVNNLEVYDLLVSTANIISKTPYARVFALKNGSALMSKMFEYNRADMFRRTTDIDLPCGSKDLWLRFCNECEQLLNASGYARYRLLKRRSETKGLDTSDSLTFEVTLKDGRCTKFSMDMNIKSDIIVEVSFDSVLNMRTYSEYTMVSDKIVVVSSNKIYRRIKDLYDICVLASLYSFRLDKIVFILQRKHESSFRSITNMLTYENMPDIQHAYKKFSGIANKPNIIVLLDIAQRFLYPFYNGVSDGYIWNNRRCLWEEF